MTGSNRDLIKLYPHDHVMRALILPWVPVFVHPNHITVVRFLLTPIVLWLLFIENYTWALPVFILAAFTDALDGSVARVRKQVTPWGIFFDPIADKLLIGSVALLVALQYFNPVIVFIALVLDILPSLRWASTRYAGTIMAANVWGKIKMFLQFSSLTLLLLGIVFNEPLLIQLGEAALVASLVFAGIAVATYSL